MLRKWQEITLFRCSNSISMEHAIQLDSSVREIARNAKQRNARCSRWRMIEWTRKDLLKETSKRKKQKMERDEDCAWGSC